MYSNDTLGGTLHNWAYSKLWTTVMVLLALPCVFAIHKRRAVLADADFLGGRAEIERFSGINTGFLIAAIVILAVEIGIFYFACVGKENTAIKLVAFIGSMIVSIVTVVIFSISVVNIHSDLKGTTEAKLSEYVLSTSGSSYYLGFNDGGSFTQMPVEKSLYDELAKGKERTDGNHSVIYDMIKDGGYTDPVDYKNDITVNYYYYCAMIESAQLE